MPEYQFVVSGGRPQPANKAVRSHAMKTALQKRADGDHEEEQPAGSNIAESSMATLKGRFRLASRPKKKKKKRSQPEAVELIVEEGGFDETPPRRLLSYLGKNATPGASDAPDLVPGSLSVSRFGNGDLDPFSSIPVDHNQRVDMLVKFCGRPSRCHRLLGFTCPCPLADHAQS